MKSENKALKKHHQNIGISWKLFAFLIAFVVFMMAVVWIFQVFMLDSFYKKTKKKELENISLVIGEYVGTENLGDAVYSCAVDYSTCIRVFKVNQNLPMYEVASAEVSPECIIHNAGSNLITDEKLNEYYK